MVRISENVTCHNVPALPLTAILFLGDSYTCAFALNIPLRENKFVKYYSFNVTMRLASIVKVAVKRYAGAP